MRGWLSFPSDVFTSCAGQLGEAAEVTSSQKRNTSFHSRPFDPYPLVGDCLKSKEKTKYCPCFSVYNSSEPNLQLW